MSVTAAIIQARLGSTRLPGKVLKDLGGRTMLAHVLARCDAIAGVDVVCCAIPVSAENDVVAAEAVRCGAEVFRGSEQDVLDRYYQTAKYLEVDKVMRVTSDCPLVDPEVCAEVIQLRQEKGADYACNNMPPTWPHGLDCEVFTFQWLERAAREARSSFEREHVTPFIRNHPDAFKVNLSAPDAGFSLSRWTVDTVEDLALVRALIARLPEGPTAWPWQAVLSVIERDPNLATMNANSATEYLALRPGVHQ